MKALRFPGGRLAGALAILGASACGMGEEPAAAGRPAIADSAPRFVADTQFVKDSLGNELMIVSKRTAHRLPQEVHPRAGSGDPSAPDAWRVLEPKVVHPLMRSARPPWYVLDVRDSRAWATRGHLPGAALVPLEVLERNVEDLHVRADQIVLIYADDESRAAAAAELLARYGFPHLRVLGGGLEAWARESLPVEGR